MKLWDKGYNIDKLIESFTTGEDRILDLLLAKADISGSKAHSAMLASVGLLSEAENASIQSTLDELMEEAINGTLKIEDDVEDIHSQIELMLTRKLGDTGKKIHLARSRNDQVLVDLRIFFRSELDEIINETGGLAYKLLDCAHRYEKNLMPGFTHMQLAMVSSFGMWFAGYAEAMTDDIAYFSSIRHQINRNPLGTAAGYGSSMPIDRQMTTELLGFDGLCVNPINAQIGRGKTEFLMAGGLASAGITLAKLAMDICQFSNQRYGYVKLPDEMTTGSSIMPHKKNPDVFEIIRARANVLQNLPGQITQVIGSLPSGYHRDFQILKEILFPALYSYHQMIGILDYCIPKIQIQEIDLNLPEYQYLFSVELVNKYVQEGMPFREAYKRVSQEISSDDYHPPKSLDHKHVGSIGNLGLDLIRKRCDSILAAGTPEVQNDILKG